MKNTAKNSPTKASSLKTRLASRFLKSMNKISSSSTKVDKDRRRHAIRAAAYASMASAVGSRKAWSRAILRKIRKHHRMIKEGKTHSNHHVRRRRAVIVRENPSFGEELNELSEVVPGGEAMDSCRLLNETGHYIKCLRAQVQIMRKILDFSSG